jgi:predicted AlkP superfamily phosphohydrolase/phosphomutase
VANWEFRNVMHRNRIFLVGIDAASAELIRANLSRLPNFRRLLEAGVFRHLNSWGEVIPGSVWPSFATGKTPGEHGIYHHIQWDPEAMRLRRVAADWPRNRPFWLDIAAAKKRVCVVDVPMSFPTLAGNALEVVSWASHDQLVPFYCNRPEIEHELHRRFSKNPLGREIPVQKSSATLKRVRDRLVESARQKGELIHWLLKLEEWDLFIAVFGETHRGGHLLWSQEPKEAQETPSSDLIDVYAAVDQSLGIIWESVDRSHTIFILFAVHGMAHDRSRAALVPFVMDRVNLSYGRGSPSPRRPSLMRFLRSAVPAAVQHAIGQVAPVGIRDFVVQQATVAGHDWSRTPGLALLADLSGYIRLNIKGRESAGILLPDSVEGQRYIETLEISFRELVDTKTDEKIVADVVPRSNILTGVRADWLPDLFVTWRNVVSSNQAQSERFGILPPEPATGRSGNHTAHGFAAVLSPSQDLDGFPALNSVTDLSRFVDAAFARELH